MQVKSQEQYRSIGMHKSKPKAKNNYVYIWKYLRVWKSAAYKSEFVRAEFTLRKVKNKFKFSKN